MVVGLLQLDLHLPLAQSLKDKRSVLKRLKDQLRGRFNISVAEIEPNEQWQRATVGVAMIAEERSYAQGVLRQVAEWVESTRLVNVIQTDEEYL